MDHGTRRGRAKLFASFLAAVAAFACSSSEQGSAFPTGGKCTKSQDCAGRSCVGGVCEGADSGAGGSNQGGANEGGSNQGGLSIGGSNQGGANKGGSTQGGSDSGASTGGAAPGGSACAAASDCQSGKCTGGRCETTSDLPNTTCTTGPDCASGICVSGACQIPAGATATGMTGPCMAGSLGCPCQPMNKCKAGLVCMDNECCDAKTLNCTSAMGGGPMGTGGTSGSTATACKPGVAGPVITECGYPYKSNSPLTNIIFNESTVLAAVVPSGGYPFASIQLFYNDEHAMTLGVRETVINGVSKSYPMSPLTKSPDVVDSPKTGSNLIVGQQAGVDPVGRPMWPALFVTDITNDPNAVSGDWQWGGSAVNPTYVAGTWKGAVRTVDASGASITPDADPAKNNMNYGNGHTPPAGAITKAEAFGAEVRWDIRLEVGHNYRFQVMVHDGDQNKVGGDSGEACVTFCAGNECPEGLKACTGAADCANGDVCTGGCCIPPPPPPPPPPTTDGGPCPPNWQVFVQTEGQSMCTPPPMDGECPLGYVITIQNNKQYCTPVQIR